MLQWEYCKLHYNGIAIIYTTYQQDGPYHKQQPYNETRWAWCLSTLGLIGWEATGTISPAPEEVAWYFKRTLDPSNDPFEF